MKMKLPILAIAIFYAMFAYSQAETPISTSDFYIQAWKEIAQFESNSLPESALKVVESIEQRATNEDNEQQYLRAQIVRSKLYIQKENNDEALTHELNRLEKVTANTKEKGVKTLMHFMLAELYLGYAESQGWKLAQRSMVYDQTPEELSFWSLNHYAEAVMRHMNKALETSNDVKKRAISDYSTLLDSLQTPQQSVHEYLLSQMILLTERARQRFITAYQQTEINDKNIYLAPTPESTIDFGAMELSLLQSKRDEAKATDNKEAEIETELLMINIAYKQANQSDYRNALLAITERSQPSPALLSIYISLCNSISYFNTSEKSLIYRIVNEAKLIASKYPNDKRTVTLLNIIEAKEQPTCSVMTLNNTPDIEGNIQLKFSYKNISKCQLIISKLKGNIIDINTQRQQNKLVDLPKETVETLNISFENSEKLLIKDTTIQWNPKQEGIYWLELKGEGAIQNTPAMMLCISSMNVVYRNISAESSQVIVTDAATGKPQKEVTVYSYTRKYYNNNEVVEKIDSAITNAKGIAQLKANSQGIITITLRNKQEREIKEFGFYSNFNYRNKDEEYTETAIFNDRAIYRPGQTIYFKAIRYKLNKEKDDFETVTNDRLKVELLDANWKVIDTKELTTNTFGSASGSFILPDSKVLTGNFCIRIAQTTNCIRVEAYKRPNFEVKIDTLKQSYKLGDKIVVKGKASTMRGMPVANAKVVYKVERAPLMWRYIKENDSFNVNGTTTTDENGAFDFSFLTMALQDKVVPFWGYRFNITTEVTDATGEMQQGVHTITIKGKALDIQIISEPNMEASCAQFIITTKNSENVEQNCNYNWKLQELQDYTTVKEAILMKDSTLKAATTIANGKSESNTTLDLSSHHLKPGNYRLTVTVPIEGEETEERSQDFIIYDLKSKKVPYTTPYFIVFNEPEAIIGQKVKIPFATSFKDVHLYYQLFDENDKELKAKWMTINNEQIVFEEEFKESYGKVMTILITFVKYGEVYQKEMPVHIRKSDNRLDLKLVTFRDRLKSKTEEEWTIQITKEQQPVVAELLATMYDASLDLIYPHNWVLQANTPKPSGTNSWSRSFTNYTRFISLNFALKEIEAYTPFTITSPEWFGLLSQFGENSSWLTQRSLNAIQYHSSGNLALGVSLKGMPVASKLSSDRVTAVQENLTGGSSQTSNQRSVDLRKEFNESAFFYPHLKSDSEGKVILRFTVPEALTTWRFLALAHDQTMNNGKVDKTVMTQKELMVTPYLPRFFRQGDKASYSARIDNVSNRTQEIKVVMEWFEPITEKVMKEHSSTQTIVLEGGKNEVVHWMVDIPEDKESIGIRITAVSENNSDGEQHLIPILNQQILVTQTMPIGISDTKAHSFTMKELETLSNETQPYSMTLEFASNTIWYAIQALPSVMQPTGNDALTYAAAYVSAAYAQSILATVPTLQTLFKSWKADAEKNKGSLSQSDQKEALKSITLNETPWVNAIERERERKVALGLLFDANNLVNSLHENIAALSAAQLPDGSWGWYSSSRGDQYTTQRILGFMTRAIDLGNYSFGEEEKFMQIKALQYLDVCIKQEYEQLKISKQLASIKLPNSLVLHYLSIRSAFRDIPVSGDTREAFDFYFSKAEQYVLQASLYDQAMTAVTLYNYGKSETAHKILRSLRERSLHSEELGMYWGGNQMKQYYWKESPLSTQAAIISAFSLIDSKVEEIDQMKIWLLKQKQTQNWGNNIATLDAISALATKGSEWKEVKGAAKISWGNTQIDAKGEAGTGYFQQTIAGKEISLDKAKVTIQREDQGIGWGALYYQYYNKADQVKASNGSLYINKQLFVKNTDGSSSTVTPEHPLQKGEKIMVRLTVKCDRDMNYIVIKDQRAGGTEPTEQLSVYKWQNGVGYYASTSDQDVNFCFQSLPKGEYVFEYTLQAAFEGTYGTGPATIESFYAPEFKAHSNGGTINITNSK